MKKLRPGNHIGGRHIGVGKERIFVVYFHANDPPIHLSVVLLHRVHPKADSHLRKPKKRFPVNELSVVYYSIVLC